MKVYYLTEYTERFPRSIFLLSQPKRIDPPLLLF